MSEALPKRGKKRHRQPEPEADPEFQIAPMIDVLLVILVFFIAMALVEDSGYLVRIAFLMDRWMSRLGLDGRAFVMQLMGLGCNVPAIMGTRRAPK